MTEREKLLNLLTSRKFWALVTGLVVLVLGERGGVDLEALIGAVALVVAYILGTALEYGLSRR